MEAGSGARKRPRVDSSLHLFDSSDRCSDDTEHVDCQPSASSQGTPSSPPIPLFNQDSLDACIKNTMASWCLASPSGVSLLDILQIEKFSDVVCSPSHLMEGSRIRSKEVIPDFDKFLLDINCAMQFSVKEMPVSLGDKKCMFGGYAARNDDFTAVLKQLRQDQKSISELWEKYKDVRLLSC